jgi:hypothetical protein
MTSECPPGTVFGQRFIARRGIPPRDYRRTFTRTSAPASSPLLRPSITVDQVPKKVQPYGSGDDTEAAALARSREATAPAYVNELAATMTIREVAAQAVEAVRALNHLTADAGELTGPGEAREVVGRLALMGHELPQLCEQLARFLVVQREDGQIVRGAGGDPDGVLLEVSEALTAAGRAAALAEAGAKAAGLDLRSP